jgi:hypothetical protein
MELMEFIWDIQGKFGLINETRTGDAILQKKKKKKKSV